MGPFLFKLPCISSFEQQWQWWEGSLVPLFCPPSGGSVLSVPISADPHLQIHQTSIRNILGGGKVFPKQHRTGICVTSMFCQDYSLEMALHMASLCCLYANSTIVYVSDLSICRCCCVCVPRRWCLQVPNAVRTEAWGLAGTQGMDTNEVFHTHKTQK